MSDKLILTKDNKTIPDQMHSDCLINEAFLSMKESFSTTMREMDEEMAKMSSNLMSLYGHTSGPGSTSTNATLTPISWETLTHSPLVEEEGDTKVLKLQFDMSQFDPTEVIVKIINNTLIVSASHKEKNDTGATYTEYHRKFQFPEQINLETIHSELSSNGMLVVRAPLPRPAVTDKPND